MDTHLEQRALGPDELGVALHDGHGLDRAGRRRALREADGALKERVVLLAEERRDRDRVLAALDRGLEVVGLERCETLVVVGGCQKVRARAATKVKQTLIV